jgi:hypothetical protein
VGCVILRFPDEKAANSDAGAINETWTFRLGKKTYQIKQTRKLTAIATVKVMGQPDLNELKASLNVPDWPWALVGKFRSHLMDLISMDRVLNIHQLETKMGPPTSTITKPPDNHSPYFGM